MAWAGANAGELQIAYSYVGNTMATFVMQSLGCEVAAIDTVHFSKLEMEESEMVECEFNRPA